METQQDFDNMVQAHRNAPKVTTYTASYMQALGYLWGRMDGGEPNLGGWEASWGNYWAKLLCENESRPSIQRAFDEWQGQSR